MGRSQGVNTKKYRTIKKLEYIGVLEIIEIFQLCFILFFCAMLGSFILTLIFTEFDKAVDHYEEEDPTSFTVIKFVETFIQLFLTAVFYFYIEKIIYIFPSLAKKLNSKYESFKVAGYVIHIVLILVLIEMNQSLVNNIHFIAKKINITGKSEDKH